MNVLKKILIVEDDQLLNRTLAYNLTSDGYEVISVFNFDSAVRKLRENEFDVALLDINLPDGSGLDLCEEIRNRGQHTYIIFITANDKESDKLKNMPNNLSGGQQQRVAIARALVSKPAIVLADEPTGNLDSRTSADVLGLLQRTSREFNQTLVMITHNDAIAQLADRIVRIEDGKIVG